MSAQDTVVRLAPDQLRDLAAMVAAHLEAARAGAEDATEPNDGELVDARTLARLLGVKPSTVYAHSAALGAREIGEGSRPRLRFDPDEAREAWTRRSTSRRSAGAESRSGPRKPRARRHVDLGSGAPLLPIGDRSLPRRRRQAGDTHPDPQAASTTTGGRP